MKQSAQRQVADQRPPATHLKVLLGIYICEKVRASALEQPTAVLCAELEDLGLIAMDDGGRWGLAERGHRYVDMLLATPLPERHVRWVDPRTGEVLDSEEQTEVPIGDGEADLA